MCNFTVGSIILTESQKTPCFFDTKPDITVAIKPLNIGLLGHMGAGKDAAAALLSMRGYQRLAFADSVRIEVAKCVMGEAFPVKLRLNQRLERDYRAATVDEVWTKPTSARMRRMLQWHGTEYRRSQDPDYWIKATMGRLPSVGRYVFSDVRFPNEIKAIRERGGVIWRIKRDAARDGIEGHLSESYIDDIVVDAEIDNSGTLIELADRLRWLLGSQ